MPAPFTIIKSEGEHGKIESNQTARNHPHALGCGYGLFDGCGEYVRNRQDAINAAALEIVDCYKGRKLNNHCIKWLLDITQRSDSQDTLF